MEKVATIKDIEGAIFEVALSLEDAAAQREFLARTFQHDPAGLEKMKSLLESAREATSFFLEAREERGNIALELYDEFSETQPEVITAPVSVPERIGSSIGAYRLIRCLGEGGSGVVYEAEQSHPVQRRVAIKIIHIDTGSDSVKARFDIERQSLAIMDHPNIAKVLDAGGVHHGSPYFVMELVEGESITTYCDREQLSIIQRIELFIDVCSAIQHAHSKRIIHRDIKPSNVLVAVQDQRPIVKVIDFGIAKAVAVNFKVDPLLTAHDQFVGTPSYMSPEQVEMIGVDVDTRSDIYSLGVLLYELLTAHTPFDPKTLVDSGVAGMRKVLLDKRHPTPSSKLEALDGEELKRIAIMRRSLPARLLSSIQGDLDWIAMKALEKDRNRRYETAKGFAVDLKCYLNHKPVFARRPNNLYTLTKFIQRNTIPFYSAVAVALSVLLGFGTSTVLYFREKTALDEQERLSLEAERSRDQELHLRRQAQARANVSRVAFLLGEGQVEEADELLQRNPLLSVEPSKEASSVFRVLGNWYATYGRWGEAVQCFRLMNQATKMNSPAEILRGADLLITAPALLEFGDKEGYRSFREEVLKQYLPVSDSLEAEHILKACLLEGASPGQLQRLESAATLCEHGMDGKSKSTFPAWEAFSLTLYHYRKGDFENVLKVGKRGLAAPEIKEICAACIRALTAVAYHKLGNESAAEADLKWSASVVRKVRVSDPGGEKVILPRWYDWSVAAILLNEAEKVVKGPAPQRPGK